MSDTLYNAELKPEWEKFEALLKQLEPRERERMYGVIQGALIVKQLTNEQKERPTA